MKSTLSLLLTMLFFSCAEKKQTEVITNAETAVDAVAVTDYLSIPGPLKFHDVEYKLVSSGHPNEIYYLQEYLPEGESLEHFNQMLTEYLFNSEDLDLKAAVDIKVQELEERKHTDPKCVYKVTESPDGKEIILEFFISQNLDGENFEQFNLFHYRQIEMSDGKKAINIMAFAKRIYGNAIESFFKTFDEERKAHFYEIIAVEKPVIQLKE